MLRWFPKLQVAAGFSCSHTDLHLSNIMKLNFQIMRFRINEKLKFLGLYFKLSAYCRNSNIILFIHFPLHGTDIRRRVGETWEPSTNLYSIPQPPPPPPPHIKISYSTPSLNGFRNAFAVTAYHLVGRLKQCI
jgi:hypothetical protein